MDRATELRRQQIARALANIDELKLLLEQERGRVAVFDECVSQMQAKRVASRQRCTQLEQTILEALTRVIGLTIDQAQPNRPTFMSLEQLEREHEAAAGATA